MRNHLLGAVGQVHGLGDQAGRDERRPVDAVGAGRGRRPGGVEPGVAAQGQLLGDVGESPAGLGLVLILDRDTQMRGGLLVAGGVRMVETQQPHVHLVELVRAAQQVE